MNCNYKVKIKDIQNKYQFKIFCKTYDDTEIQGDIETLNSEVEALQEENLYLNNLVEQAFDKKEVEGEELSIDDTINAKMEVGLEGNTTQETTTGKNKWGSELQQGARVFSNGTLNTSLTTYVVNKDPIPVIAGQTYTISAKGYNFIYGGGFVFFNDGTFVSGSSTNNTRVTIPSGCNQLYYNFYNPDNISVNDVSDIQLEPGSTASSYEKYTGGVASPNPDYPSNVNVVTGDNTIEVNGSQILNINDVPSTTKNGITYSANDNVVILNGTSTANTFIKLELNRLIPSGKTISYSANNSKINNNVSVRPANNGNALEVLSLDTINKTRNNYTLPNDMNEVYIVVNNGTSLSNFEIKLMANIGTTALPYEEHQEQTFQINLGNIEVCGIGDYRDYLYKSNNKWYKHSEIGKVVLDGTYQNLSINTTSTDTTRCSFVGILSNPSSQITSMLCNNLQVVQNFSTDVEGIYYNSNNGNLWFRMNKTRIGTTESEINTYLSTHNTIIYYILATPTDTEITDTTLISQLEALKSAMSYAEQTNISQINNDVPFILQVTALASYNSRILALENAILNANRSTPTEQTEQLRKSNEIIEEPKEEVVDDNKDKNIIKEEK